MATYSQMYHHAGDVSPDTSIPIVFLNPRGELGYVETNYPEKEIFYLRRNDPVLVFVCFHAGGDTEAREFADEVNKRFPNVR